MPAAQPVSSVWVMIVAALVTDAAVLGTIHLVTRGRAGDAVVAAAGGGGSAAGSPADGHFAKAPTPYARCLQRDNQPPSIVAVTYLDRGRDAAVTLGELRGWFGKLPPAAVQVWWLESRDPRYGRRISFEVPEERWPAWLVPDPSLVLDDRCLALYQALRAHGVGRPRPDEARDAMDTMTRSRHDFEFLFPRRPEQYVSMTQMGTVADLTEDKFAEMLRWLDDGGTPP